MNSTKYCSGCGNELSADMQFCPKCGKVVKGSEAEAEIIEKEKQAYAMISEGRRGWLTFLLALYAIPVIIMGAFAIMESGALASSIYASPEFHDWIISHGYTYTEEDIKNFLTYAAAMVVASGACAMVTLYCLVVKKMWIVAVVACAIASFLCFWSILGLLMGLLVTWQVYASKDLFIEGNGTA